MVILKIKNSLNALQAQLNFEDWDKAAYPQFATNKGLGRTGVIAGLLGILLGIHLILWAQLSLHILHLLPISAQLVALLGGPYRILLLWQWTAYAMAVCSFHFLEFFTTILCNPSAASSDSFLVNHSTSYSAATLSAIVEFSVRFFLFPTCNSFSLSVIGLAMTLLSQALRTSAMVTAGESFNHYIQTARKENHVLVTHGVYRYLRHPSYSGFYFWSISTQLLLGNYILFVAFAVVSWNFFKRRIAYEEESLCVLFPEDYSKYLATSFIGIPFLWTNVKYEKQE